MSDGTTRRLEEDNCDNCNQRFKFDPDHSGEIRCPKCKGLAKVQL